MNTAGITGATGDFHEIDDAGWLETLNTNLMGAVRVARAFVPHMLERKSGRIVLIVSEDAEQPYVDELPYCASKAGIRSLAKGLSKAYGKHGILVNAVGRPSSHEVAAAILFLVSSQATFITGANLRVDGGSVATI